MENIQIESNMGTLNQSDSWLMGVVIYMNTFHGAGPRERSCNEIFSIFNL
jgi:hypothetical protein